MLTVWNQYHLSTPIFDLNFSYSAWGIAGIRKCCSASCQAAFEGLVDSGISVKSFKHHFDAWGILLSIIILLNIIKLNITIKYINKHNCYYITKNLLPFHASTTRCLSWRLHSGRDGQPACPNSAVEGRRTCPFPLHLIPIVEWACSLVQQSSVRQMVLESLLHMFCSVSKDNPLCHFRAQHSHVDQMHLAVCPSGDRYSLSLKTLTKMKEMRNFSFGSHSLSLVDWYPKWLPTLWGSSLMEGTSAASWLEKPLWKHIWSQMNTLSASGSQTNEGSKPKMGNVQPSRYSIGELQFPSSYPTGYAG